MKCIVCAAATQSGLFPWHAACPHCLYEAAALSPSINQSQAHALVDEDHREDSLRALREANFDTILEKLQLLAPSSALTLLDVGSAHGWFLERAAARFKVMGIEPDSVVARKAAARGLPVRQGYFPDALANGETFDVIVFNDVIEHIPNIGSALAACHARLNPGGLLVLNLPSSRGFFYRLSKLFARIRWRGPFDRMWQKDLPSPHVHYFNEKNLEALVGRHGFDQLDSFGLATLHARGLLARLRCVGKVNPVALYAQYAAILLAMPLVNLFPRDIVVCVFRKQPGR